jgi:YebC/PmpR family DNA-binding regulatory protein
MSGHSHWATIKHKKGALDARRGRHWSKLSRAIIIAAKNGGGDPSTNLKLRYAIDKAKVGLMPKDTIERAIKRGTGELGGEVLDEVTYEGFAPGGIAVMVDILTDNRNRTNAEVRKFFERAGGNMGGPGCVAYLFDRKGLITIPAKGVDEDNLMMVALEAGAEDLRRHGDFFEVITDPAMFLEVQEAIRANHFEVVNADIPMLPKTTIDPPDVETAMRVIRLMETLDDYDDTQNVYSNMTMTDAVMAELAKE